MSRVAALLGPLLLAACAAGVPPDLQPPVASRGPDPLAQVGTWRLQGATDQRGARMDAAFPHGRAVHGLVFEDGRVGITGGCNHMGADYGFDAQGRLVVGAVQSTAMACEDQALMAADAAVADLVAGAAEWRIAESWPEQLFLDHADGRRSTWVAARPGTQ